MLKQKNAITTTKKSGKQDTKKAKLRKEKEDENDGAVNDVMDYETRAKKDAYKKKPSTKEKKL